MSQSLFVPLSYITGIVGITLLFLWSTYNRLVRFHNQVHADYSNIDIQLKRRASLIDNLVAIVKSYAKHEKDTFTQVAQARAAVSGSKTVRDAASADVLLSSSLMGLFGIVENYPELKASENYQKLREDLVSTENGIALYREQYNASVLHYNNTILTFPTMMVARLFGFAPEEFFRTVES